MGSGWVVGGGVLSGADFTVVTIVVVWLLLLLQLI